MLLPVILCFWQFVADPIRPSEQAKLQAEVRTASFEQNQKQEIQLRKKDFEKRFNQLIDAIKSFSEAYNQSTGAVWPEKKAEALRKAMRNLENSGQLVGRD